MKTVKEFYKDQPFNYTDDRDFYVNNILKSNQILEYPDLHQLLLSRCNFFRQPLIKTIIEFGCGTGWLTNSLLHYYQKQLTSIDFTEKAVDIASDISTRLNKFAEYKVADIFEYQDSKLYDLVVSMGVLHHTKNCREAFKKISKYVKPGGYLYVGLYHLYGRKPMLSFLQNYAHWHGESSAYNLFKRMNNTMDNKQHSYSWFRDQVIHPHETQHTLVELSEWIADIGFTLQSTSINKYKPLKYFDKQKLSELEHSLESYSYKKNVEELIFTPGYFTVCAKRNI